MSTELITELEAICTEEPRGDFGLDGFQRGQAYRCQLVQGNSPRYYRVFPRAGIDDFQSMVPRTLTKYFRIEEKS